MKAMLKRFSGIVLTLCMILGVFSLSATAALDANYTFMATAYSSELGVYVAVTRDLTNTTNYPAKIYTSKNALTWVPTFSVAAAKNYGNSETRQILTYWKNQKIFVAAFGEKIYKSEDGTTWAENTDWKMTNAKIDSYGDKLVILGDKKIIVANSKTDIGTTIILDTISVYEHYLLVGPGNDVYCYAQANSGKTYSYKVDLTTNTPSGFFPSAYGSVTGTTYVPEMDKWITVSKSTQYQIAQGGFSPKSVTLEDGSINNENITTCYYLNGTVYLGTENGKIYYAKVPTTGLTDETMWSVAQNDTATTSCTEEIRSITVGGDSNILVSSQTQMYLLKNGVYYDIQTYKAVSTPTLSGVSEIFYGIKLLGGAYSPSLNKYVVYGNDIVNKGHIYSSDDGISWKETMLSNTRFNHKSTNGIVWWENKGIFVISASFKDGADSSNGTVWYSSDGENWSYTDQSIGACRNGDIIAVGDYLYTPNADSKIKYKRISYDTVAKTFSTEDIAVTGGNQYYTAMGVSNEPNPSILLSAGYGQATVYDSTGQVWAKGNMINTKGPNANDIKWNPKINKFIVARNDQNKVFAVGTTSTSSAATKNVAPSEITAFDTNGTNYIFGATDGQIYKMSDTIDMMTNGVYATVGVSQKNCENNTYPVTDVFLGANNKIIATVSDGSNSDVLIVNADGSGYIKANDNVALPSLVAGEKIKVTVESFNNTSVTEPFSLITAIYTVEGKLLQTNLTKKEMVADSTQLLSDIITLNSDIPSNAKMKVFMWGYDNTNSIVEMNPLGSSTDFFQ